MKFCRQRAWFFCSYCDDSDMRCCDGRSDRMLVASYYRRLQRCAYCMWGRVGSCGSQRRAAGCCQKRAGGVFCAQQTCIMRLTVRPKYRFSPRLGSSSNALLLAITASFCKEPQSKMDFSSRRLTGRGHRVDLYIGTNAGDGYNLFFWKHPIHTFTPTCIFSYPPHDPPLLPSRSDQHQAAC